jgi:hypothetical protein
VAGPKKSKRQAADEAWLKNQQLALVEEPKQERRVPKWDLVPVTCPSCCKPMTFASGWAIVFGDLLQCGNCAHTIEVPRAEFERFGRELHTHFARMNHVEKRDTGPRVRGAG